MALAALRDFVRNVLVIVVMATFLQLILPQGSMRRYAHLAVALVLVLTMLQPLLALTRASWDVGELLGQAQAQTAWAQLQAGSELFRQQNEANLLATYRRMLETEISDIVALVGDVELIDCNIAFVEDREAADFGRILRIEVVCRESLVAPVEEVQIELEPSRSLDETQIEAMTRTGRRVQQAIAKYFLLTEDQVSVIVK